MKQVVIFLFLNMMLGVVALHAQDANVAEWEAKAKDGDVSAQYNLGVHY